MKMSINLRYHGPPSLSTGNYEKSPIQKKKIEEEESPSSEFHEL
jgi:hypothetical protein